MPCRLMAAASEEGELVHYFFVTTRQKFRQVRHRPRPSPPTAPPEPRSAHRRLRRTATALRADGRRFRCRQPVPFGADEVDECDCERGERKRAEAGPASA